MLLPAALLLPSTVRSQSPVPPPEAPALTQAAQAAQQDYEKGLRDLAALRDRIKAEKLPLAGKLSALETSLATLRSTYDAESRSQDTRALEATNLSAALKLRQDEVTYISNLMDEYARGFDTQVHVSELERFAPVLKTARLAPQDNDLPQEERLRRQAALIGASIDRVKDLLGGTRYEGEAVDPQGAVARGRFAMVGPVVLFAGADGGPAGIAVPQAGSTKAAVRPLEKTMMDGLRSLVSAGTGILPLDPSRGGALKEMVSRGSLIGTFRKGGPIMWPLLFVSLLALTVILERVFFLARERSNRDDEIVERIFERVAQADIEGAIDAGRDSRDFIARAMTYALQHRRKSLSNALMRAAGQELVRYNRGISILDTCVTMAPLLGLLGTVTGMMGSFGMMGGAELGAPAQITGGIAEALIATSFGLGIAVTALIPMNYLHSRSEAARHEIEDASTHLELLMKPIQDAEAAIPAAPVAVPRSAHLPGGVLAMATEIRAPLGH